MSPCNPNGFPLSFVDSSVHIGIGVHIWHFCVILAGVRLGDDVSIGSHTEVGRGCIIGDRTRIGKGCFLPSNTLVGNDVFIGPGVIMCDDKYPRAGNRAYDARPPCIDDRASIGAGCVLLPGVRIGRGALVGAGAVVTSDIPADTIVYGDAARIRHTLESFPNVARLSGVTAGKASLSV